jgi:D-alanyl-lipoteichoic acid acyltransferase DltB (MBOAT superfamily)
MLFNSQIFLLVFLPLTMAGYYLTASSRRMRLGVLSAASLVFYGYWDVRLVPLLVGSITANWLLVRAWARWRRRAILYGGVAFNLVLIGIFKYADFLMESLLALFGKVHEPYEIALPLGISFFTFQQIIYLVDLARGERRIYGYRDYFLFVTFFPQLIAGPIVRHDEIIGQFRADPRGPLMWERLSRGAVFIVLGLSKKVLLADPIAALIDPIYLRSALGETMSLAESWIAASGFTLQVYFDFSGYSDIALGLGLLCGFQLPINFDAPYRATSIRDFWRR